MPHTIRVDDVGGTRYCLTDGDPQGSTLCGERGETVTRSTSTIRAARCLVCDGVSQRLA
jgi:hypothetical protein